MRLIRLGELAIIYPTYLVCDCIRINVKLKGNKETAKLNGLGKRHITTWVALAVRTALSCDINQGYGFLCSIMQCKGVATTPTFQAAGKGKERADLANSVFRK